MESCKLSDDEKELFKHVTEGNFSKVKNLISQLKLCGNCYDKDGMTLLQHAAFKGHYEICKLLLDCGADVNESKDVHGYSALSMAAISNHCDVVTLLLEHGANAAAINANKRTAAEMAAFVGNHRPASIINNYIAKDVIDYFTEVHGLEDQPRLPMFLSSPVHKLVIMSNIHPVRIALYLQTNIALVQNLKKVIDVLNILAEKQLKEMVNERLSLKSHHIAFVLSSINDYIISEKKNCADQEIIPDQKILDLIIKSWLKGSKCANISLTLEKFLRKCISAYPYRDCVLYQRVVTAVSATDIGNEPNSLTVLNNVILGQHFSDIESCVVCDEQGSIKLCSGCKNVHYCNKICQKLHWFIHKSACKK